MRIACYKGRHKGLPGLFDAAVRWWTGGPYSHCELVLSEDICGSSSVRDGGVRLKRIDILSGNWDLLEVGGDEQAAVEWFNAHLGAKYDYAGLFGFIWRPGRGNRQRWFCSEAVAAALGFEEPWRFDPNTLAAAVRLPITRRARLALHP